MRRVPVSTTIALLAAALAGSGGPLSAQQLTSGSAAHQLDERQAARALRAARSEQARFERVRRNHLDWTWSGGGGECDERIGRFCLTHSESTSEWESEPEPEEIGAARDRLLERLAEAARLLPAERWVSGQRVRYLVEAQRMEEAVSAARACRSEAWWCTALEGFARHNAGEAALADDAFARMLEEMPPRERKEWTDLTLILDDCSDRAYRALDDAGRDRFEERFWHLADPFHTRPGNELRSEHFARNVWDALQDRAKSTEGISWGEDLREISLRYGWPRSWKRIRDRPGQMGPPSLMSHYSSTDLELVPPCEALLESGSVARGTWDEEPKRPKTGYALPMPDSMIEWVTPLEHQVAVFRRGDSALVVAAYEAPADSFPDGANLQGGVAILPGGGAPLAASFATGGMRDVLVTTAPSGSSLLSLELLALDARRATRARHGLEIPDVGAGAPAVSDLLLLRDTEFLPDSLAAAVAEARGGSRVRAGEQIGIYWEVYGAAGERPEQITMSLRLVEEGAGWLRRFARRIGIAERVPAVRVRWQDLASGGHVLPRSLAFRFPEDVPPGRYTLQLAVTLPGRDEIVSSRAVEVVK